MRPQEAHDSLLKLTRMDGGVNRDRSMQAASQPALDNLRMNIRTAAYGWSVSKESRDFLDGRCQRRPLSPVAFRQRGARKYGGGMRCPTPCPKVLDTEVVTADKTQIIVDLPGVDRLPLTIVIEILEEPFAWELLHAAHDPCKALVAEFGLALLPAFATKCKTKPSMQRTHMFGTKRG